MRFISFDLETTGVLAGVDRIVEIGAVRYEDKEVTAVFSTLVDPGIAIPEGASRVNGIYNEMVQGKPKIEDLLPSFAEFCGDDIIVAHNAPFDFQFLTAEIKRFESPAPLGFVIDTYYMAKKIFPGLANYKLGTLVQHLQIPSAEFHRAEADASYCGQLFIRLVEKIHSDAHQLPPIENLVALAGRGEMKFPQIIRQPKQLSLL